MGDGPRHRGPERTPTMNRPIPPPPRREEDRQALLRRVRGLDVGERERVPRESGGVMWGAPEPVPPAPRPLPRPRTRARSSSQPPVRDDERGLMSPPPPAPDVAPVVPPPWSEAPPEAQGDREAAPAPARPPDGPMSAFPVDGPMSRHEPRPWRPPPPGPMPPPPMTIPEMVREMWLWEEWEREERRRIPWNMLRLPPPPPPREVPLPEGAPPHYSAVEPSRPRVLETAIGPMILTPPARERGLGDAFRGMWRGARLVGERLDEGSEGVREGTDDLADWAHDAYQQWLRDTAPYRAVLSILIGPENVRRLEGVVRTILVILVGLISAGGGLLRFALGTPSGIMSLLEGLHDLVQLLALDAIRTADELGITEMTPRERALLDERLDSVVQLILGLERAVDDWQDRFEDAHVERRSQMLGDFIGQILPMILTLRARAPRVPGAPRVPPPPAARALPLTTPEGVVVTTTVAEAPTITLADRLAATLPHPGRAAAGGLGSGAVMMSSTSGSGAPPPPAPSGGAPPSPPPPPPPRPLAGHGRPARLSRDQISRARRAARQAVTAPRWRRLPRHARGEELVRALLEDGAFPELAEFEGWRSGALGRLPQPPRAAHGHPRPGVDLLGARRRLPRAERADWPRPRRRFRVDPTSPDFAAQNAAALRAGPAAVEVKTGHSAFPLGSMFDSPRALADRVAAWVSDNGAIHMRNWVEQGRVHPYWLDPDWIRQYGGPALWENQMIVVVSEGGTGGVATSSRMGPSRQVRIRRVDVADGDLQ